MATAEDIEKITVQVIDRLEHDGILSSEAASQAREQYVVEGLHGGEQLLLLPVTRPTDGHIPQHKETCSYGLLSLSTAAKTVALVFMLAALWATFLLITPYLSIIPVEVFQAFLMCIFLVAAVFAKRVWESQAPYIAALGSFSCCLTAVWVVATHPPLVKFLDGLEQTGWPVGTIISAVLMLLYASLAVTHGSQLLGFAAAVCFSSILGFGVYYYPHCLGMYIWRSSLNTVVYGHMAGIAGYLAAKHRNVFPNITAVFKFGVEYYFSIAMGCGFLLASSPWEWGEGLEIWYRLLQLLAFVLCLAGSMYVYFFLGTKTVGSVLCVWGVFIAIEWYWFVCSQVSFVFALAAAGGALFGGAVLLDRRRKSGGEQQLSVVNSS